MNSFFRTWAACLLVGVGAGPLCAQWPLPPAPLPLNTLEEFRPEGDGWRIAGAVGGDPRTDAILATTNGTGILVGHAGPGPASAAIVTRWDHDDMELDLDFLLTPGARAGVILQGRHLLVLSDGPGDTSAGISRNGTIVALRGRADSSDKSADAGAAPQLDAGRLAGLWQHVHLAFEAARFDTAGRKIHPARFREVRLNGFLIHENVAAPEPTAGESAAVGARRGPLGLRAERGSVAFRAVSYKRAGDQRLAIEDLRFRYYQGDFKTIGDYDRAEPVREGATDRIAHDVVATGGRFAITFNGSLKVPRAGDYAFRIEATGPTRLLIDGRTAVTALDRTSHPGALYLEAGAHELRLDFIHYSKYAPSLSVLGEGLGILPHSLTPQAPRNSTVPLSPAPHVLLTEARDRVRVLRSFTLFEDRKRFYTASVGTPVGLHYTYDLEAGAILQAWRGPFVDVVEMWENRGLQQIAKPAGAVLPLSGKPTLALIEFTERDGWPARADRLWTPRGYSVEPDGQPTFLAALADLEMSDRIAPAADGRALSRTIRFKGTLPDWSAWVLLAEAATITPQPGGRGWVVGDRDWYLDWPLDAAIQPVLRTTGGLRQLAVPLTRSTFEAPIRYELAW